MVAGRGASPLAAGRSADLFALDGRRVLRRYRDPTASCEYEARVMQHVRAHGFPVPAVHDASGPDLVMDRVDGVTMLSALRRAPWTLGHHAADLARLHEQLHAIPAPSWLSPAPFAGTAILHLDLHPLNVLVTPAGPVVIDWPNTQVGAAPADVAHTWLVLATGRPDARLDRALSALARAVFVRRFLAAFALAPVLDVLPAVAERWLSDRNITERERTATRQLLRRARRS